MTLTMEVTATAGPARAGLIRTARGEIRTPCFMPVGTRGAVRTLSSADLSELGVQIVLGNTYHLMLKPGADVVERLGGLHGFADWPGAEPCPKLQQLGIIKSTCLRFRCLTRA